MKKKMLPLFLTLLVLFVFISCDFYPNVAKPNTYKVVLDYNDGTHCIERNVEEGTAITLPTDLKKDKSIFIGWFNDKKILDSNTVIVSSPLTLIAGWYDYRGEIKVNDIPSSKVIKSAGDEIALSYDYIPSSLVKWNWKVNGIVEGKNPNSLVLNKEVGVYTITLECNDIEVAKLNLEVKEDKVYTIYYYIDDDSIIASYGHQEGDKVTLIDNEEVSYLIDDELTLDGFIPLKPNDLVISKNQITMPNSDVSLRAKLVDELYQITIKNDSGYTLSASEINPSKKGSVVYIPKVKGLDESLYSAIWSYKYGDKEIILSQNESFFIMPNSDVDLTLDIVRKAFDIKLLYISEGITLSSNEIKPQQPSSLVTLPIVESKIPEGYSVVWYEKIGSELVPLAINDNKFKMPGRDISLVVMLVTNTYEITPILNDWEVSENIPSSALFDSLITLPSSATKTGYTFNGWKVINKTTGEEIPMLSGNTFKMPACNVSVLPNEEIKEFNLFVKYVNQNGNEIETIGSDGRYRYSLAEPLKIKYATTVNYLEGEYNVKTHIRGYNYSRAIRSYYIDSDGKKVTVNVAGGKFTMPEHDVYLELCYTTRKEYILDGRVFYDAGGDDSDIYYFYDKDGYLIPYNINEDSVDKIVNAYSYVRISGSGRFYEFSLTPIGNGKGLYWGFYNNVDIVGSSYSGYNPEVLTSTEIGTGKSNTKKILSYINSYCTHETGDNNRSENDWISHGTKFPSKGKNIYKNCSSSTEDTYLWSDFVSWNKQSRYSDWFIPAADELKVLYDYVIKNKDTFNKELLEIFESGHIWSSSAWIQDLLNPHKKSIFAKWSYSLYEGKTDYSMRHMPLKCIPVRSF